MPVDAAIPLAAGQIQGPDPRQLMSLAQFAQVMQQRKQQMAAQNQLRSLFATPGSFGTDGQLTPDAINRVGVVDPMMGLQLRQQSAEGALRRSQIEKNQAQLDAARMDQLVKKDAYIDENVRSPSIIAYEQAIKAGKSPAAASEIAQAEYTQGLDKARASGLFHEDEQSQFNPTFDYQRVLARSQNLKDYRAQEEKRVADERAARTEAERERHNFVLEKDRDRRDALTERRLDTIESGGGQNKPPAGYRWSKDKPGELEVIPGGPAARKEGADLTVADKMNPVMLATVRLDVKEGRKALDFINKRGLDKGSAFYADEHGASAATRLLHKFVTPDDQQEFDVYANKLGQAIASAQSMGRGQISEAKVREAQKAIPVAGDSRRVREVKLQQLKNFFDYVDEVLKTPIKPGARGASDEAADRQDAADFSHLWD